MDLKTFILLGSAGWAAHFSFRYAWWRRSVPNAHARILMYHMISPHRSGMRFNKMRVKPEEFKRQLKWLKDKVWSTHFVSELVVEKGNQPRRVALTFDDGFEDNFTLAHPLMVKFKAKGTLYLVVDRHKREWSSAKKKHHRSGELGDEPKLTDEQVVEMLNSGLWELGGHTITHPNLLNLDSKEKRREILEGKAMLEDAFGVPIQSFAYPFGLYDRECADIVKESGMQCAVTVENGISRNWMEECYDLKRLKISGKDGPLAFHCRMRTGYRGFKS